MFGANTKSFFPLFRAHFLGQGWQTPQVDRGCRKFIAGFLSHFPESGRMQDFLAHDIFVGRFVAAVFFDFLFGARGAPLPHYHRVGNRLLSRFNPWGLVSLLCDIGTDPSRSPALSLDVATLRQTLMVNGKSLGVAGFGWAKWAAKKTGRTGWVLLTTAVVTLVPLVFEVCALAPEFFLFSDQCLR